jgi:hypothetical protein
MNLRSLTDERLLETTQKVVESERRITADAINHFFEINRRQIYCKMGYDSLFTMLRRHYGYCEPTAQLRKNAVFLMRDVPDVIEKIQSGEMPVTVASNIQSFLQSEKKAARPYSVQAKIELVEFCSGKSVRDVQNEFVKRNPEIEKHESIRFVSEDRVRVSHSLSNEVEAKIQRIKMLWSHVDPNMSREQILDRMAEITLDHIDPFRKSDRAQKMRAKKEQAKKELAKKGPRSQERAKQAPDKQELAKKKLAEEAPKNVPAEKVNENNESGETHPIEILSQAEIYSHQASSVFETNPESELKRDPLRAPEVSKGRYIIAEVVHAIHQSRVERTCEYVSSTTGRKCCSKFQVQIDHMEPYSEGGSHAPQNLRFLCSVHNRWSWQTRSANNWRNRNQAARDAACLSTRRKLNADAFSK